MRHVAFICAFISLLVVYLITPWLIRYLRKIDLVVKDMNKENKPLIPASGGLAVMAGMFAGLMVYIFLKTFFRENNSDFVLQGENLLYLFAGITSMMIISFVGFIDDLVVKESKESTSGLRQWQKPLLTLAAAVPLMAVAAGTTEMAIPIIGRIDIGLLYPLLIIPIGVVGAANMVNMLGGFNGMETGMGLVYMGMLGLYAYVNKSYLGALIALLTFSALIGFYFYNRYPAKILPGDSLTYLLGGSIATIAILGNIEKAALIVSIPFIAEFFLKLRSRFKAASYGYYEKGKIKSRYNHVYSLPHLLTRTGKFSERQVVMIFVTGELLISSLIWVV